jgi:catechol 2,3-dioxygenase-like lactoylglutathione lyase family enzyme
MTILRICWFAIMLGVIATSRPVGPQDAERRPPGALPTLANVCLITNDMKRLVGFYEPILALKARWSGQDYAEFRTSVGVLAVFAAGAQENYIPGSAQAAENRSVILEFSVADVDLEYQRLQNLVKVWVKPPTTQLWGTRSIYFRDPDGNLVDFYTPPKR